MVRISPLPDRGPRAVLVLIEYVGASLMLFCMLPMTFAFSHGVLL